MNWSKRTVNDKIGVEKLTVNDIFLYYLDDKLYVNRRYQRKLVWETREKRLLIDSMLKKIPLPAVFIANYDIPGELDDVLEIVDGMQRLNAIVSFLLGEFEVEYDGKMCYFDPMAYPETGNMYLSKDPRLLRHEDANFLPKSVCVEFYRYQLSVIVTGQDDSMIDLIFSRINSTGKKISSQDLRQSAAVGDFPDLVRRIASNVRQDNTYSDHICFCDIPKISVGSKQQGYGVDIETVFWRRHDLINEPNIKESKDEEIIETLLATVLLKDFKKSKDNLDCLYEQGSKLNMLIETEMNKIGKEELEDSFKQVFDLFDMIFDSVNSNFSAYLFKKKNTKNKDECFKVMFLTLYQLLSEGYVVVDHRQVAERIQASGYVFDKLTRTGRVDYSAIAKYVKDLYLLIKPCFTKAVSAISNDMVNQIDKRLGYSKIESQMTEFKIGISDFKSDTVNQKVIDSIAQTLVGMSNTSYGSQDGLLVIGIADNINSYKDWHNAFGDYAIVRNQHYVPGIQKEAEKLFGSVDIYYRKLREYITAQPISEKLKEYILETFEPVDYHDVQLIVFKSKNMGEIRLYDGTKFVRQSSETIKVDWTRTTV